MTDDSCIHLATYRDKAVWDDYVLKHPNGIAYQLYGFKQAVELAYGFEGVYFMARARNRVQGILPLVHVRLPGRSGTLVSLPYCDAGGLLADSVEIERLLLNYALTYSRKKRIFSLGIRSIHPFARIDSALTLNHQKVRMLLPLPDCPDLLFASLNAKVRSQVKKPIREGLTFQMGGKELLSAFYKIFCENMRDLGSPVHSIKWIQGILKTYKNRAHIGLVRMPDNKPCAAGIVLCHPRVISIPWASSLRRFNHANPNMLLYWQFLKFASVNGYPVFDFGRSTPGQGTFRFKKQWGAIPQSLHWADFKTGQQTEKIPPSLTGRKANLGFSNRKLAETILSRTPVAVTTLFGSHIRKYIPL